MEQVVDRDRLLDQALVGDVADELFEVGAVRRQARREKVGAQGIALPLELVAGEDEQRETRILVNDIHCNKFEISNNHWVWVSGKVTVLAKELFKIQDYAKLRLLPGATMEIYFEKDGLIENNVDVNVNTADPSRLMIYNLG